MLVGFKDFLFCFKVQQKVLIKKRTWLLLFEAVVLPQAADGGLDARIVLVIRGGAFLGRAGALLPQTAGSGWTQRLHLGCWTPAVGLQLRQSRNLKPRTTESRKLSHTSSCTSFPNNHNKDRKLYFHLLITFSYVFVP